MAMPAMAFLSYVHFDDQHDFGRLSELSKRLAGEVRVQLGRPFEMFHDKSSLAWGDAWRRRIEESLDGASLLIPVITPGYFNSVECRREFERFVKKERELNRSDLILPIYYVEARVLNDENARAVDSVVKVVAEREYLDWRELRFEPLDHPDVQRTLARMALQMIARLEPAAAAARPPVDAPAAAQSAQPPAAPTPPRTPVAEEVTGPANPSPKTAPPTCIVDPRTAGAFGTVREAIAAVSSGGRVLVRPGQYRESLVIEKSLEIVGDGDRSDIVLEGGNGPAILFRAPMGRVTNLTVRQPTGTPAFAIDIAQGRLDLEGCDISSHALACVAVHDGADPRVRRNRIHDGREQGILIFGGGMGTIEDNDIAANQGSGVEVRAGSAPTLRGNRISDGHQGGVFFVAGAEGLLEDNEVYGNAFAAIEISTGADPTLRRNRIRDSTSGIFVNESGRGTAEDNDIVRSSMAGVVITSGGHPTLRRNAVHDGQDSGILVAGGGRGELIENQVFDNEGAGVAVTTGGDPIVRNNRIFGNGYRAVWVYQSGQGRFEDNDLTGSGPEPWDIADDSVTLVDRRGNRE